jgi:hypothetical protein
MLGAPFDHLDGAPSSFGLMVFQSGFEQAGCTIASFAVLQHRRYSGADLIPQSGSWKQYCYPPGNPVDE